MRDSSGLGFFFSLVEILRELLAKLKAIVFNDVLNFLLELINR
jgi:hypothetical protein